MQILEGLNPEQRRAAEHVSGPMLVIAGAGTGKTQVITRRIAHLIESGAAQPHEVLALTFTEKAAREMQDRLYELIGWQSFSVPVSTFNSFGAELLARYAVHIGRSVRGGLVNETQKVLMLKQHIDSFEFQYYGPQQDQIEFISNIVAYIGELQNKHIQASDYLAYVDKITANPGDLHPSEVLEQQDLARLYALYENLKRQHGVFDYSDQLAVPLEIFTQKPHLAERLGREYRYVLVDEYQDTSPVQDALLRTFIPRNGNIFAVGDDDQAIYGFRGADVTNILRFADHFELSAPVTLVRNYRSGQAVLDASYRLIQGNNPNRLEARLGLNKQLLAQRAVEAEVAYVSYSKQVDELNEVAEGLERARAENPGRSLAVLAATHAPLSALAKLLDRRGVPYALSTTINIFSQPELLSLWHLMGWLNWSAADEAVAHVLLGTFFALSPAELSLLQQETGLDESLEAAMRRGESSSYQSVIDRLDEWRIWARDLPVSQLVFRLIFDTGVGERWQKQGEERPRFLRVFEDLQRLLEQMQDFETMAVGGRLSEYLSTFPVPPHIESREAVGDESGVQLLTVHASKGLEFDEVYVIGCTAKAWSGGGRAMRIIPPELNPEGEGTPLEEARRLMYVAITRAKERLVLSSSLLSPGGVKQAISPLVVEALGDTVVGQALDAVGGGDSKPTSTANLQRFYPLKEFAHDGRLPFEDQAGWIELSVTALGGYEFCPFEFYLQHVLGIASPMGPQLSFGTSLHHVFEHYYGMLRRDGSADTALLHRLLDESWSEAGYLDRRTAEADRALAHRTLDAFVQREATMKRVIVGVEMPVRFEIPEIKLRLRGKIDFLSQTEDGVEIRDFKTGRTKTDAEKLSKSAKENFQLRTYALAHELLTGSAPSSVVLDYVVTGVEGEAKLSAAILKNHRQKLGAIVARIRQRDFAPNPSALHQCSAIRYYGTGEAEEAEENGNAA